MLLLNYSKFAESASNGSQTETEAETGTGTEFSRFESSYSFEIWIGAFYSCLLMLGSACNLVILVAIFRTRLCRTATGKLLANRCIADLLVCVTNVVFTPLNSVTLNWSSFPMQCLCRVLPAMCALNIFASSLTATFLALHRKRSVLATTSRKSMVRKGDWLAGGGIPLIWLASLTMAAPIGFVSSVDDESNVCTELWTVPELGHLYTAGTLLVQLFVPAATCIYCYVLIAKKVMEPLRGGSLVFGDDARFRAQLRKKQRVNRLMTFSILAFVLCFLPINIFNVHLDICRSLGVQWPHIMEVYHALHIIAMSSVCWNPLFCILLSGRIKEFVLTRNHSRSHSGQSNGSDNGSPTSRPAVS